MPHYETLSPLQAPLTYLLFIATWLSCLICILISLYFYFTRRGTWWLLIALAMALPLLEEIGMALWVGLPPLPYQLAYPPQQGIDLTPGISSPDPALGPTTTGQSVIEYHVSRVQWSLYPMLMAAALIWAFRDDRKKRAAPVGPPIRTGAGT